MKAPGFWARPPGLESALLRPLALLYGAVADRRLSRPGVRATMPVVCIGNVTVGGSGKTPTAIAVAALLREAGRRPAFLTRGYGGRLPGPLAVHPGAHGAADVGDEPLLLARHAPTVVSRDRPAGASLAARLGADVVVMDDGLQNPSLTKDLRVAVFDGAAGIGNGRVLPAGPLRATLLAQWPLIDAVVVVGRGAAGDRIARDAEARLIPVFRAALHVRPGSVDDLVGRRVLAFAGIGRPSKFVESCREAGLEVAAVREFPDHHPYRAADVSALLDRAARDGLVPVTTDKDQVRLARLAIDEPRVGLIRTLPVEARFEEPEALGRLLLARVVA